MISFSEKERWSIIEPEGKGGIGVLTSFSAFFPLSTTFDVFCTGKEDFLNLLTFLLSVPNRRKDRTIIIRDILIYLVLIVTLFEIVIYNLLKLVLISNSVNFIVLNKMKFFFCQPFYINHTKIH